MKMSDESTSRFYNVFGKLAAATANVDISANLKLV